MKRISLCAALLWPLAAYGQTAEGSLFTLDKIVGAVGLPVTATSNASRRNVDPNADAYAAPTSSITATGKIGTWGYVVSAGVTPEFYNRYDGLDKTISLAQARLTKSFQNYNFAISYINANVHRDLFEDHLVTQQRITASLTRKIALGAEGWSIVPGIEFTRQFAQGVTSDALISAASVNFGWSDCERKKNLQCWTFAVRPELRYFYYDHFPGLNRRDLSPSVVASVDYNLTEAIKLSGTVRGTYNDSNVETATYRRLDFTPQLSLSHTLYEVRRAP